MKYNILTTLFSFCLFCSIAKAEVPLLFSIKEIPELSLKAPFVKMEEFKKANINNLINLKKQKFDGEISYFTQDRKTVLPVEISIKGFTSSVFCKFPKLELKIKKSSGTLFEGIKKIDLNTHCDDSVGANLKDPFISSMMYNHREVVSYKIQEILGLQNFLTQSIRINYTDVETGKSPEAAPKKVYDAFLIEDKSEFIIRNQVTEIKDINDVFKQVDIQNGKTSEAQYQFKSVTDNKDKLSVLDAAKVELFENIIYNLDYFIKFDQNDFRNSKTNVDLTALWNIRIFENKDFKNWFILAQDYNFSAISMIHIMPELVIYIPLQNKFISQLLPEQRKMMASELQSKKEVIMLQLEKVKADPDFDKLKNYLDKRIDFLITELNK